jgi:hypothetical protein
MEPNNFEKDFREKLNNRQIEPSNKAWDRLDAMLSVAEEQKTKKKNRKWLYIAASFVGFLLVGTFFFNQNKNTIEAPRTVVVEKEIQQESVNESVVNDIDSVETEIVSSEKNVEKTIIKQERINNQTLNKNLKNELNQVAESSIVIKNNQSNQSANNSPAIAETAKKENVDQLLQTAENKVLAESPTKKAKVRVNASDLLNQVDGELELSFREKMITKVNKNFQEVKVAVTNRNKQE